jgi:uncharacterized protein YkwD
MSKPNRRFRTVVNLAALAIAGFALASAAPAAKRKRVIPPTPMIVLDPFALEMLRIQNEERLFQGRQPLVWDEALAADAGKWANHMARNNIFEHAFSELGKNRQGENLWMGTHAAYALTEMVSYWIAEAEQTKSGKFPDVSKSGNWTDVGHFTQLVWPETRKVGCALKSSAEDDYLVCRYWPAGNRIGDNFTIRARK